MLPEATLNQFGTSEFKELFALFNDILLKEIENLYPDLPKTSLDHLKKVMEYNVPHGKLNRGLMVIEAFSQFRSSDAAKISKEELMKASCLGWCIEWLQAFFLVADDVMDSSLTRRGQPCWFRQPEIGLMAVNDSLILRSSINLLLKNQFESEKDGYFRFSELFREVELSTEVGQMLDMTRFSFDEENLMNRYELITKYKTSLYSFYLPFACAFILANNSAGDADTCMKNEKDILMDIGHLFQVQDDILDAFGDSEVTGKIGRDIEEGKCTWLLCKCLSLPHLTETDRNILKESRDSSIVKGVYENNRILNHFETFQYEIKTKIERSIANLSRPASSLILTKYLNKIVKRIR